MRTKYINCKENFEKAVQSGAECLRNGEIISYPTETVYGFGVDLFNLKAVKDLYTIKQRPESNPLSANIYSLEQVKELSPEIPDLFYELAKVFLPGPLSIVLKKKALIHDLITAGLETISIRMPDNDVIIGVLKEFNGIMAGTSANISGKKSFNNAHDILSSIDKFDINQGISLILDDGPGKLGLESTVISLAEKAPKIIRQGAVPKHELEKIVGIIL